MDLERVEKPLWKLRKLLKSLPEDPAPADVHKLRTRARRIEAVASALAPAGGKESKRLLKAIQPVRKAAGSVRDMDVLAGNLLQMEKSRSSDSRLRLIEHLGGARIASACDLLETVGRQRKKARRELKSYAELVESVAAGKKPVQREPLGSAEGAESAAADLVAELAQWPRLNARNLHSFRLKVKALRYLLQTLGASDAGFLDALGKVKDEIGDWHDWQQLLKVARQVLDRPQDREFLAQIAAIAEKRFARARASATALRRRYLRPPRHQKRAS